MSLLVLTNSTTSININPPETVVLKVGLTPAGAKGDPGDAGPPGIQGDPVPITTILGQSTTEAVSQKLLTDELSTTNGKVTTLEGVSGKFKNVLDNAVISIWIGTQAELDAIAVKDAAVMYMVKA
ncbi:hypothetical protein Psyc_1013 [Psychrobacter arcticus 273-4]|uniref:Minor tail protein gp31 C-terminal domain-containing protein n=1 Tax=Psychrobacter arcticus (strain DSM 17307 / VKM B-2377 / 273-4) TaxID=259536 RepID=Q4FSZ2_PSYA2|nr:collagen-like protein [Psychrobacter arcticus]AAZ18866.1 hypothetical protein Psyc_1013 [Psychrobacter arcticus 273-4]